MDRLRLLIVFGLVALVLPVAAAASGVDKGTSRPPTQLTNHHKAIWMSEWVACWRVKTLQQFARELKMTNARFITPQQSARLLSKRANGRFVRHHSTAFRLTSLPLTEPAKSVQ